MNSVKMSGSGHGEKLTRKQEQAIVALLTEPTILAAAATADVCERTLRNWLRTPDFLAEYRAARRQLVESAIGRLQQAAAKAVDTLEALLECGHAPTRARAAAVILERAVQAVELTDLMERLEQLEAHTATKEKT